ncbi:TRAP transporter fused permease subunit [Rhodobacteraceae bacterium 2CG4]|uniref:TRAP transporter fused permease subunit n=1 Tax=Halovulum marinum TaxID=2662447 RepID=A0A6L5YXR9_9RHOB|nr:TRAP transporter fused permease subunit [Halovulum marinum]MSU88615.1 TRAP transporter fused permease subunit [Halovulum marinum]
MGTAISTLGFAIRWLAILLGAWHLALVSGWISLSTLEMRIVHLAVMLVLVFLSLTKTSVERFHDKIAAKAGLVLNLGFAAAAAGTGYYLYDRWMDIALSGGLTTSTDALVGMVVIALVMIAAVRKIGWFLAIIVAVFLVYPLVSPWLPGVFNARGYSAERLAGFLTTSSEGVYGIPLGVSATYIIMFSIFGAFLSSFGAGDFFFQLSRKVTGTARASSAKTAVIFSTLLGMISGSAAGNVAVTGTMTIPMMKREGYKPHQAGAIEAVVSTGGQIMPPVMGAAAFIMAEIIGVAYSSIMAAALIPALLFFASIFFVVHLQALRIGIGHAADTSEPQSLRQILVPGLRFIVPFFLLVAMMVQGYSPFRASFVALGVLLAGCAVYELRDLASAKSFLKRVLDALESGTLSVMSIAVACAAAGIIAGVLAMTGLGSKISGLIVLASGGIPVAALLLTMLTSIILGMGLPTTAAYLILATVVAPALVNMGVPIMTAHLFVFFYGCISTITPPVALASYVAAGIAGAEINKTSWTAFAFGITSFILPFMFFFGPGLLMQGSVLEIAVAAMTGLAAVFCFAVAVTGYLYRPLGTGLRVLFVLAGGLLMYQSLPTDVLGILALAGVSLALRAQSLRPALNG